jgi:hypothetical protein
MPLKTLADVMMCGNHVMRCRARTLLERTQNDWWTIKFDKKNMHAKVSVSAALKFGKSQSFR